MPKVVSNRARPGAEELTQLARGAVAEASDPRVSVLPSQRSCQLTPSAFARAALARSISRGKSISKRCGGV
jgi:hypothetical protein